MTGKTNTVTDLFGKQRDHIHKAVDSAKPGDRVVLLIARRDKGSFVDIAYDVEPTFRDLFYYAAVIEQAAWAQHNGNSPEATLEE